MVLITLLAGRYFEQMDGLNFGVKKLSKGCRVYFKLDICKFVNFIIIIFALLFSYFYNSHSMIFFIKLVRSFFVAQAWLSWVNHLCFGFGF